MKPNIHTGREADRKVSKQMAMLYLSAEIQVRLQSGYRGPTRVCPLPTGAERDTGHP